MEMKAVMLQFERRCPVCSELAIYLFFHKQSIFVLNSDPSRYTETIVDTETIVIALLALGFPVLPT